MRDREGEELGGKCLRLVRDREGEGLGGKCLPGYIHLDD